MTLSSNKEEIQVYFDTCASNHFVNIIPKSCQIDFNQDNIDEQIDEQFPENRSKRRETIFNRSHIIDTSKCIEETSEEQTFIQTHRS